MKQHELARRRQVRHVALEVPASAVAVGRPAERDDARLARAQVLDDALDGAVLSGGVAPLEQHEDLVAAADEMALQLRQLDLQAPEVVLVALLFHRDPL